MIDTLFKAADQILKWRIRSKEEKRRLAEYVALIADDAEELAKI